MSTKRKPLEESSTQEGHDSPKKRPSKHNKKNNVSDVKWNSLYQMEEFKRHMTTAFASNEDYIDGKTSYLQHNPFKLTSLPKFIHDPSFIEKLKIEMEDQIYYQKNNDLYKFQQSDDLKKSQSPYIKALRKLLYGEFLDWLRDVTGIPLSKKVDMTCSRYDHTDVLLCHDDELEDRRIAYILYLVPPWTLEDGGTLDLFSMDEHGQPGSIVHSVVPNNNMLAFFEVTEASHHQVSEVLSEGKVRLSINGWFHGPPVSRQPRYIEPSLPLDPHTLAEEDILNEWINPIYLDINVQSQIQEKFEEDSEIELKEFLKEEKYQELLKSLADGEIEWEARGPANKRNYCSANKKTLPSIVRDCIELFKSEVMFLTLSNMTGLTLHALANNDESKDGDDEAHDDDKQSDLATTSRDTCDAEVTMDTTDGDTRPERNPRCRGEVRRWKHGSYTLVHDTDTQGAEFALDAMLYCGCKGWKADYGGFTSYIARGEDEELLTVNPDENSLALVYRDKDTLRFVKHINSACQLADRQTFYDIAHVYYE